MRKNSDQNNNIKAGKKAKAPRNKSFLFGALVLSAGGVLAKLLGVLYRIPLTNIIGAEGIGLYQMVFPFYTLLLTISSAGLPAAISKMVAEYRAKKDYKSADKVFKVALVSLSVLGIIASLIVFALHKTVAGLQGNSAAALSYVGIAPALFFVALISAFRGYFQGRQNMLPTALSQLTEQAVKIAFGLTFAYLLMPRGVAYAALGALIGVSISELFAALQLWLQYIFNNRKEKRQAAARAEAEKAASGADVPVAPGQAAETREGGPAGAAFDGKALNGAAQSFPPGTNKAFFIKLFKVSIPITLGAIVLPLTQLIDSALVINILKAGGFSVRVSTILYGLMTGHVMSLINMPVVLSVAVATAVMPGVAASNAKGDKAAVEKKAGTALKAAVLIAVPCVIAMCFFSRPIVELLYRGGLKDTLVQEGKTAAQLLSVTSVSILYIAVMQVITAVLQAVGKMYLPVRNLAIGAAVKIVLNLVLVSIPSFNIYGAAVSTCACYAVAAFLDIFSLRKHVGKCEAGLSDIFRHFKKKSRS